MAGIFSFKCSVCAQIHEGAPSFAFNAPDPYLEQPEEIKKTGWLGSDLCNYSNEQGFHYFIRVVLEIPIHGITDPFVWGVWVSLSEQNYLRYVDTYNEPDPNDRYFGWFCNYLPFYDKTYGLKVNVHPRANGDRPYIALESCDHQLALDFTQGISIAKAQEVAEFCMHR